MMDERAAESFTVQELLTDGDRVTGIRGRTSGGATATERARIVIGADGQHSLVARPVTGVSPRDTRRGG
jgi:2-polyprenyl-6-methoxyphenol hydroxylase-like FAD-dependent oxidoreductase